MAASFPLSAICSATNVRSLGKRQKRLVPTAEPSLLGRLRETDTCCTINARRRTAVEQELPPKDGPIYQYQGNAFSRLSTSGVCTRLWYLAYFKAFLRYFASTGRLLIRALYKSCHGRILRLLGLASPGPTRKG
jgi:hypothetical protein